MVNKNIDWDNAVQGLAPNSGQRVLTPNSEHFLCLLLHFWSDSAHIGLNRTEIITYKFRNEERYSFRSLNVQKREKVHLKYPPPVCFLFFGTNNFIIFKLKTCTLWDFTISSNFDRSIYLSLGWISWEVKQLFMSGIGSPNTLSVIGCQSLYY